MTSNPQTPVPRAAGPSIDAPPSTPERDAGREAAAKKGWHHLLDLIEAQADAGPP